MIKKVRMIDKLVLVLFVFFISFYFVIKILNRITTAGLVFSKLHIQPNSLIWPILISLLLVAVLWIPRIDFKKLLNIRFALLVFVFLIIAYNFFRIYKMEWWNFQFIIANPHATYDDKMRRVIGAIFYNYALFVDKYTPENASILVPPQTFPWPGSGNIAYFRYFVYPRNIYNGKESEPPSKEVLSKTDYVLLNWGETDQTEGAYTHDWPKFDVKAEKIIFMNEDGSFGGEVKGDYRYKDYKGKRVWGIIVVKH
jgi:hypothetical protein